MALRNVGKEGFNESYARAGVLSHQLSIAQGGVRQSYPPGTVDAATSFYLSAFREVTRDLRNNPIRSGNLDVEILYRVHERLELQRTNSNSNTIDCAQAMLEGLAVYYGVQIEYERRIHPPPRQPLGTVPRKT